MLSNQTGHDETGKRWNWKQTREAVTDPVVGASWSPRPALHLEKAYNMWSLLILLVVPSYLQRLPQCRTEWRVDSLWLHNQRQPGLQ